ncbi:MAG: class I SAM-dependent methyltransferase [bacterium]|nr:class I SAM-dependent methyltransferase [bacterium]
MEFTGERFVPGCGGDIALEHYHRYFFALPLVQGKRVLDIASGEGYGSHILAREAAFVTGVDIAEEAVAWSAEQYSCENIRFLRGSVTGIPLDDASVDVVVSFETLEHVAEQEQKVMLREIRRVLVPGGLLILSTPNVDIFDSASNHFHVKELCLDEFLSLLDDHFAHRAVLGQKLLYGSVITAHTPLDRLLSLDGTASQFQSCAVYFIALASDSSLPFVSGSILEGAIEDSDRYRTLMKTCKQHESEHMQVKMEQELAAMHERLAASEQQVEEARNALKAVLASRSWRITAPLRNVRSNIRRALMILLSLCPGHSIRHLFSSLLKLKPGDTDPSQQSCESIGPDRQRKK